MAPVSTSRLAATRDDEASARRRGATRLHAAQRLAYRERLVGAAAEVFVERSYAATTVDDILTRANVSRPTFYRYFDSKFDLAVSLIRTTALQTLAPYDAFVAADERGPKAVRALLEGIMGFYEQNAPLVRVMTEIAAIDPHYMKEIDAAFLVISRRLGKVLPAFRASGPSAKPRATRARILLNQIATTCQLTTSAPSPLDRNAALKLLTKQFLDFCATP